MSTTLLARRVSLGGRLLLALFALSVVHAFSPPVRPRSFHTSSLSAASSTQFTVFGSLPKIRQMKKQAMREELEGYGISTEALTDKKKLTRALQKARRAQAASTVSISDEEEEEQPDAKWSASGFFEDYDPTNYGRAANSGSSGWQGPNIWNMHLSDMRMELEGYGISTENLLERRQLARALEDARAERSRGSSVPPDAEHYHSYTHHHHEQEEEEEGPKNEYVNYAYAGNNADFYKSSAASDFLERNEDVVDAEVESRSSPEEETSTETREVEMHRYDPRAFYRGLIIDTDVSP